MITPSLAPFTQDRHPALRKLLRTAKRQVVNGSEFPFVVAIKKSVILAVIISITRENVENGASIRSPHFAFVPGNSTRDAKKSRVIQITAADMTQASQSMVV